MIHRECLLARPDAPSQGSGLKAGDIIGLLILAAITLAFAGWTVAAVIYR
jgi:hypothetical protein